MYELHMATGASVPPMRPKARHSAGHRGLYGHRDEAATSSGFLVPGSSVARALAPAVSRIPALEPREVNILRGLLKSRSRNS